MSKAEAVEVFENLIGFINGVDNVIRPQYMDSKS